jgi:hypothetical protein
MTFMIIIGNFRRVSEKSNSQYRDKAAQRYLRCALVVLCWDSVSCSALYITGLLSVYSVPETERIDNS